jgi:hypothetical protein
MEQASYPVVGKTNRTRAQNVEIRRTGCAIKKKELSMPRTNDRPAVLERTIAAHDFGPRTRPKKKCMLQLVLLLIAVSSTHAAIAQEPQTDQREARRPTFETKEEQPKRLVIKDTRRKNYLLPGLEIVAFDILLNRFNRVFVPPTHEYKVSLSSIERNLRSDWPTDNNSFLTNQAGHPYQGSIYHGFARSVGLNYWEASAYTFAGSLFWEIAGERTPPARNDQVASGIGGTFLGESLFRLSNLVLEDDTRLSPYWREWAAAALSPPTGFNRYAFGDRFDDIFDSRNPAYYRRLLAGVRNTTNTRGNTGPIEDTEAVIDFSIDYGLPGKPGYTYTRPFDYFTLQASATTATNLESLTNRGLILGRPYEIGKNYRGIWGLYGGLDYLSNQLFRVSSTALSIGTTAQWWLSDSIALQGSGMAGIGYNGAASIRSTSEQDFNYGFAPQGLASLRLIFGDKASLDVTARRFLVDNTTLRGEGHDRILRADASFTMRVYRQHAIAVRYVLSRRNVASPDLGSRRQSRGTIGIFYTNLGNDGFGAVEWR